VRKIEFSHLVGSEKRDGLGRRSGGGHVAVLGLKLIPLGLGFEVGRRGGAVINRTQ